ncbi:MAG: HAD-IIB family hydrolase [Bacteroidota bacterium]
MAPQSSHTVVFSDLDGTLLDKHKRLLPEIKEAVQHLKAQDISLIFCSSKTRSEQELILAELDLEEPIIVENGSGIFIPHTYFNFEYAYQDTTPKFKVIELGVPSVVIRTIVSQAQQDADCFLKSFYSESPDFIGAVTGLSDEAALRANVRDYSEVIVTNGHTPEHFMNFEQELHSQGLCMVRNTHYSSVIGIFSDEGRAVQLLGDLLRKKHGNILSVGIADCLDDYDMLAAVDLPFLVKDFSGNHAPISLEGLIKVEGKGPNGWLEAIQQLPVKMFA